MNVAPRRSVSLFEIVETAAELVADVAGVQAPEILTTEGPRGRDFGMDGTLFCETFAWQPAYDIRDAIRSIVKDLAGRHPGEAQVGARSGSTPWANGS